MGFKGIEGKEYGMTSELKPRKNDPAHILYTREDKDAPESIKDSNGDIALGLCKICGKGEVELEEPCAAPSADTLAGLKVIAHLKMVEHTDFDGEKYTLAETSYLGETGSFAVVKKSEAAAIIAAERAEINKLNVYNGSYRNQILELRELLQIAEAKLAQIKAQEPVAWQTYDHDDGKWFTFSTESEAKKVWPDKNIRRPLYASPVSDVLKAENERFREALTVASMSAGFQYMTFETRALIDTALKGNSND